MLQQVDAFVGMMGVNIDRFRAVTMSPNLLIDGHAIGYRYPRPEPDVLGFYRPFGPMVRHFRKSPKIT